MRATQHPEVEEPERGSLLRRLCSLPVRHFYRAMNPEFRRSLSKIPGIFAIYRYAVKPVLSPPVSSNGLVLVRLHGFTMYVDPEDVPGGFSLDLYEPTTTFIFNRLISDGDIVIDIGAHWGYFTLLAATLCGNYGKVFAFEPHPRNYALLTKNIAANRLANVVAAQKAVSNRSGIAELHQARSTHGHSLRPIPPQWRLRQGSTPDTLPVDTVSLDEFFAESSVRPKLVKMDIEGAEPLALSGMRILIERNPRLVLITEFNPAYFDAGSAGDLLQQLADYGFNLIIIDDDRRQLEMGPRRDILKRLLRKGRTTNLLCSREPAQLAPVLEEPGIREKGLGPFRRVDL